MESNSVEKVTSLFICATPLQSLIACKIIEKNELAAADCSLFYYSTVTNSKIEHYYQLLAEKCAKSIFYLCKGGFHKRALGAKSLFRGLEYTDVYFASAHTIYVQLALSQKKHKRVYTFDDGAGNLTPVSVFNTKYGHSYKKHLASRLFGNTYDMEKIKAESLCHYTIYPHYRNNISDNLVPVQLFDYASRGSGSGRCSVVLGTVYNTVFAGGGGGTQEVLNWLSRFINTLEGKVFYIPHPRDQSTLGGSYELIDSIRIAEDLVLDLLGDYKEVDLYGFCSSAQINLAGNKNLHIYYFSVPYEQAEITEMRRFSGQLGIDPEGVIELNKL